MMNSLTKLRGWSRRRIVVLAGLTLAGVWALAGFWRAAAQAADRPILHLENADGSRTANLALADLQAMGRIEFDTSTPWTDGVVRFEGVPLAAVLKGMRGQEAGLQAVALNDYVIEMPIDEVLAYEPILAWAQDGQLMSIRERGPLWLVFDFDRFPETQNEVFLSRSIWQLKSLRLQD